MIDDYVVEYSLCKEFTGSLTHTLSSRSIDSNETGAFTILNELQN